MAPPQQQNLYYKRPAFKLRVENIVLINWNYALDLHLKGDPHLCIRNHKLPANKWFWSNTINCILLHAHAISAARNMYTNWHYHSEPDILIQLQDPPQTPLICKIFSINTWCTTATTPPYTTYFPFHTLPKLNYIRQVNNFHTMQHTTHALNGEVCTAWAAFSRALMKFEYPQTQRYPLYVITRNGLRQYFILLRILKPSVHKMNA